MHGLYDFHECHVALPLAFPFDHAAAEAAANAEVAATFVAAAAALDSAIP